MRHSNSRSEMAAILRGGPGNLVICDLGDNSAFLQDISWPATATLSDWVQACLSIGVDLNVVMGEAFYLPPEHPLGRKRKPVHEGANRHLYETELPTPLGSLTSREISEPGLKPARTEMFIKRPEDYQAVIAYLRALRECGDDIVAHLAGMRRTIGEVGFLSIFIPQPLEMFCLILHEQIVYDYLDYPEIYGQAMAEVEATSHFIIDCAAQAGADMIVFGGAGTEIFNEEMIDRHIVQPAIRFAEHSRRVGLFTLMHCCGRTRLLLQRGWFATLQPDIFESFTPAPLGDIVSPRDAVAQLPAHTFFKGGLNLERLLLGTPDELVQAVADAYETYGHHRFILAGSCGILTGTPRENLIAITQAAANYHHEECAN